MWVFEERQNYDNVQDVSVGWAGVVLVGSSRKPSSRSLAVAVSASSGCLQMPGDLNLETVMSAPWPEVPQVQGEVTYLANIAREKIRFHLPHLVLWLSACGGCRAYTIHSFRYVSPFVGFL